MILYDSKERFQKNLNFEQLFFKIMTVLELYF